ncbi:hypothetical protein [Streptomyces palmae]|nr:hypothetical protein [Streptomyces palmae]
MAVIPADRLVELLRANAGRPDPEQFRAVVARADRVLRRYVQ